jgi:hypothetical protein
MSFWYNTATDGEKFNSISCADWNQVNTNLEFDELAIKEDEDFYYLYGQFTKATDITKVGDKDWKFEPQLLTLKIAKKDYQKYSMKEKKRIPVSQSRVEKYYSKVFSGMNLTVIYSGKIQLQDSGFIDALLTGVDPNNNNVLPDAVLEMMASGFHAFKVVDEPTIIKPDEIKLPTKSGGNWGSGKSQTEYEKLGDRVKFVIEQFKLSIPHTEVNNFPELIKLMSNEANTNHNDYVAIWSYCLELFR